MYYLHLKLVEFYKMYSSYNSYVIREDQIKPNCNLLLLIIIPFYRDGRNVGVQLVTIHSNILKMTL